MKSNLIIERWYKEIQILSEALPLSIAKFYTSLDRKIQDEVIDPIWDKIVKQGSFTSKRNDRVYFEVDPNISISLGPTNYTAHASAGFGVLDIERAENNSPHSTIYILCGLLDLGLAIHRGTDLPFELQDVGSQVDIFKPLPAISDKELRNLNSKLKSAIQGTIGLYSSLLDPKVELYDRYSEESTGIYLELSNSYLDLKDNMIVDTACKKMKVGTAVQLVLNKYFKPAYGPTYAKASSDLKAAYIKYSTVRSQDSETFKRGKSYRIVFSKHPVDIAGMSADRGWRSCMTIPTKPEEEPGKNRKYVKCDVQEGTFIAYLIDSNDLNIKKPIGRVLIKPYYGQDTKTLLYRLENRTHGQVSKYFIDTVASIINTAQPDEGYPAEFYSLPKSLYRDSPTSSGYSITRSSQDLTKQYREALSRIEDSLEDFYNLYEAIHKRQQSFPPNIITGKIKTLLEAISHIFIIYKTQPIPVQKYENYRPFDEVYPEILTALKYLNLADDLSSPATIKNVLEVSTSIYRDVIQSTSRLMDENDT